MSQTERSRQIYPKDDVDGQSESFRYSVRESIGYLVRAASRALQRALEERITLRGINLGQWYFLRVLWEEDGLSQRELSNLVGMTEPTTVVALNSLERVKLIRRVRNEKDRRKVHVYLTQKGKRLRGVMLPLAKEINDIATENVSDKDIKFLRSVLERIIGNLNTHTEKANKGSMLKSTVIDAPEHARARGRKPGRQQSPRKAEMARHGRKLPTNVG